MTMHLFKRDCPVRITLIPFGAYYLRVELEINGDRHCFMPSGSVVHLFSEFMGAVYALYHEGKDCHNHPYVLSLSKRAKYTFSAQDSSLDDDEFRIESEVSWDEEGALDTISFRRVSSWTVAPSGEEADPVSVVICYKLHNDKSGTYTYTVDGRDLCYAIGKAATSVIKKYGFYGYHFSTGWDDIQSDLININQLVFFKAYALNAMEARTLKEVDHVFTSSFEKELELLLFEM